jgi:UDP:flavonoid glycosyltransferase YjiC (YdhE family)
MDYGLDAREFIGLHITASQNGNDLLKYAQNFARYLKSRQYDCVVVDRLCIVAAFSAHLAGLPWATIGTDGREWARKRWRPVANQGVFPGSWEASPISSIVHLLGQNDFPRPSDRTFWATSPFLNISFFPRLYYQDTKKLEHPKCSHFVGTGEALESQTEQSYLLVTFGNSFNPTVRQKLIKILQPLIREQSINVLFLTGSKDVANSTRRTFRHDSSVEVREWMPYDRAYRGAIGVVGHGGTSHIWYGLREGKPLLAIPFIADQFYGAFQLERLNIGRIVVPFVVPRHLSRLFRKMGYNLPGEASIYLSKRKFSCKLNELLKDQTIRDSTMQIGRFMRAGGGVHASASLIERLARFREPVSTCVTPACCC